MRVLALETSSRNGSVAALEDDRLLGQTSFEPEQRAAQAFAPAKTQFERLKQALAEIPGHDR